MKAWTIRIAILLFVAFSIGLNIGMHGALSYYTLAPIFPARHTVHGGDADVAIHGVAVNAAGVTQHRSFLDRSYVDTKPVATEEIDASHSHDRALPSNSVQANPSIDTIQAKPPIGTNPLVASAAEKLAIEHLPVKDTSDMGINAYSHSMISAVVTNQPPHEQLAAKVEDTIERALEKTVRQEQVSGPISKYIASGKKFPILLLAANRPELLEQTIDNLLAVRGVDKKNIIVSQDGALASVADVVQRKGLDLVQNTAAQKLRGGAPIDGGAAIAKHYKFSLSKVQYSIY
jgi:hypothetical protein